MFNFMKEKKLVELQRDVIKSYEDLAASLNRHIEMQDNMISLLKQKIELLESVSPLKEQQQ